MTRVFKLFQEAPNRDTYRYAGVLLGLDLWNEDALKAFTPLMDRVWTNLSAMPVDNVYDDVLIVFYKDDYYPRQTVELFSLWDLISMQKIRAFDDLQFFTHGDGLYPAPLGKRLTEAQYMLANAFLPLLPDDQRWDVRRVLGARICDCQMKYADTIIFCIIARRLKDQNIWRLFNKRDYPESYYLVNEEAIYDCELDEDDLMERSMRWAINTKIQMYHELKMCQNDIQKFVIQDYVL